MVSIVAGLGILNGLSKFYYQCKSEGERKELVSTTFILIIAFYSTACAAGVLASPAISRGIFGMGIPPALVAISFVNLFLQILFSLVGAAVVLGWLMYLLPAGPPAPIP